MSLCKKLGHVRLDIGDGPEHDACLQCLGERQCSITFSPRAADATWGSTHYCISLPTEKNKFCATVSFQIKGRGSWVCQSTGAPKSPLEWRSVVQWDARFSVSGDSSEEKTVQFDSARPTMVTYFPESWRAYIQKKSSRVAAVPPQSDEDTHQQEGDQREGGLRWVSELIRLWATLAMKPECPNVYGDQTPAKRFSEFTQKRGVVCCPTDLFGQNPTYLARVAPFDPMTSDAKRPAFTFERMLLNPFQTVAHIMIKTTSVSNPYASVPISFGHQPPSSWVDTEHWLAHKQSAPPQIVYTPDSAEPSNDNEFFQSGF